MYTKLFVVVLSVLATCLIQPKMSEEKYVMEVDWFDTVANLHKNYTCFFYPVDNSIEMFDVKHRKIFLKRTPCNTFTRADLYPGNTITVLGRDLKLLRYGDEFTERTLKNQTEKTFAMVKSDAVNNLGKIVQLIEERGFKVTRAKMAHMSYEFAKEFYKEHIGRSFFDALMDYITSGPVVGLELTGNLAVKAWRETLGPTDPNIARSKAPRTIRALYGKDTTFNAGHGSDSPEAAQRELDLFFNTTEGKLNVPISAAFQNSFLLLIKPHAVHDSLGGKILADVQEAGFQITGLKTVHLNTRQAEDFYEVYQGVLPDYLGHVRQFTSGTSIAVEVVGNVTQFRQFCGPMDPVTATKLRPKSLRAKYGLDSVKNAVHCTDLPEDGPLEVEYFFKILP